MLGILFAAAVLHQVLWRTGVHYAAVETEVETSNDVRTLGSCAAEGRDRVY
jgi:hypothetical protein